LNYESGHSLVVGRVLAKDELGVRFPLTAQLIKETSYRTDLWITLGNVGKSQSHQNDYMAQNNDILKRQVFPILDFYFQLYN
jgi:hypothetical protein